MEVMWWQWLLLGINAENVMHDWENLSWGQWSWVNGSKLIVVGGLLSWLSSVVVQNFITTWRSFGSKNFPKSKPEKFLLLVVGVGMLIPLMGGFVAGIGMMTVSGLGGFIGWREGWGASQEDLQKLRNEQPEQEIFD